MNGTGSTFGDAGGGVDEALASKQARRLRGVRAALSVSSVSAASDSSEPELELPPSSSSELDAAAASSSSASEPRSWKASPDAGGADSTVFRGKHRSCLLVYAYRKSIG
jgi:hypothetical protein